MPIRRLLHWLPRLLAIFGILFLALFALDVFGAGYAPGELMVALLMHLLPNLALLAALLIAWRWRRAGGALFVLLGVVSIFFFRTYRDPITFLIVSLPVLVVGGLFLLDDWLDTHQPQRTVGP
jgi:hypothetical protein